MRITGIVIEKRKLPDSKDSQKKKLNTDDIQSEEAAAP
jgi:hypothetical protein